MPKSSRPLPETGIARALRRHRKRRGVLLKQLAAVSGYSTSLISAIEFGDRRPSLESAIALALGLGLRRLDLVKLCPRLCAEYETRTGKSI